MMMAAIPIAFTIDANSNAALADVIGIIPIIGNQR